jgi:hypothetical protein
MRRELLATLGQAIASRRQARDYHNDSHVDDAGGRQRSSLSDHRGERDHVHSRDRVHEPCHVRHTHDWTYIDRDLSR